MTGPRILIGTLGYVSSGWVPLILRGFSRSPIREQLAEMQRKCLKKNQKGEISMNTAFNAEKARQVQVTPSPDTFLDADTVETCAGCGETHPVERLSLFLCCFEYFCEKCSCACAFYPDPNISTSEAQL
jgi:hypothetical protein